MQGELNQLVYKEALTGGRSLSNTAKQQPGYCWVLKGTEGDRVLLRQWAGLARSAVTVAIRVHSW